MRRTKEQKESAKKFVDEAMKKRARQTSDYEGASSQRTLELYHLREERDRLIARLETATQIFAEMIKADADIFSGKETVADAWYFFFDKARDWVRRGLPSDLKRKEA